jgi:hypothetical protein
MPDLSAVLTCIPEGGATMADGARGQMTKNTDAASNTGTGGREARRLSDWLRHQETPPAARRMDPPGSSPVPQSGSTPVLNRLTAQFDRVKAGEPPLQSVGLAEMLNRRLEARKAREGAAGAAVEPGLEKDTEEAPRDLVGPALHLALADIIARQNSLSAQAAATEVDAIDSYFGAPSRSPAVSEAVTAEIGVEPLAAEVELPFEQIEPEASIPHHADLPEHGPETVEQAVGRLAAHFDQTTARGFATLEACHSEIMQAIRESHAATAQAAEAGAARAIETSLETLGGTLAGRIENVAHLVADLKAGSTASERRTCDMLDAVRETLELVAERLPRPAPGEASATAPLIAAQERGSFIAAARRQAATSPAPDVRSVDAPRLLEDAAVAPASPIATKVKKVAKPNTTTAKTSLRRRLMLGCGAIAVLAASYGGAWALLNRNLAPEQVVSSPIDEGSMLLDPQSEKDFNTAEAGAPSSYRPTEPAALDAVPPLSTDLQPPAGIAVPEEALPPISVPSEPTEAAPAPAPTPADSALTPLQRRTTAGDPAALYETALRLVEGRGVPRDPARAAEHLGRAASAGLAPAQYLLGSLKEKGTGVPKDIPGARQLYEQAAASGNVQSMHNLGVLHAEGGLGKPNMKEAYAWFSRAADLGLKDSQYNLGVVEARGLVGKPDLAQAYVWFALAAKQGDGDAAAKRDQVATKLSNSDLASAQSKAAGWKAQPLSAKANTVAEPPEGWDHPVNANRVSTSQLVRPIR